MRVTSPEITCCFYELLLFSCGFTVPANHRGDSLLELRRRPSIISFFLSMSPRGFFHFPLSIWAAVVVELVAGNSD